MEFLKESVTIVVKSQQEDNIPYGFVEDKLNSHDEQLQFVEERLEAISEAPRKSANIVDNVAQSQCAALELKFQSDVRRAPLHIYSSSSPAPPTASSSSAVESSSSMGNISVVGGIGKDMPEEGALAIANAFLQHGGFVRQRRPRRHTASPVRANFKFPCAEDARSFVPTIRDLPSSSQKGRTFWATVRHPKGRRARIRRLLRGVEALQRLSELTSVKSKTAFDRVCWSRSSVVLGKRRIAEIHEPHNYKWTDGWCRPDFHCEKQGCMVSEVEAIERRSSSARLGRLLGMSTHGGLLVWSWNVAHAVQRADARPPQ